MSLRKSMKGSSVKKSFVTNGNSVQPQRLASYEKGLYEIQLELSGLAALFENLGYSEFSEEQLKGVGQILNRLAQAIADVREC